MPHINFKGIKEESVKKISKDLVKKIAELTDTQEDWFSVEYSHVKYFMNNEETEGYPVVMVNWFDRGQDLQDKVAKEITDSVLLEGYKTVDVIFTIYEKNRYYENGEHF